MEREILPLNLNRVILANNNRSTQSYIVVKGKALLARELSLAESIAGTNKARDNLLNVAILTINYYDCDGNLAKKETTSYTWSITMSHDSKTMGSASYKVTKETTDSWGNRTKYETTVDKTYEMNYMSLSKQRSLNFWGSLWKAISFVIKIIAAILSFFFPIIAMLIILIVTILDAVIGKAIANLKAGKAWNDGMDGSFWANVIAVAIVAAVISYFTGGQGAGFVDGMLRNILINALLNLAITYLMNYLTVGNIADMKNSYINEDGSIDKDKKREVEAEIADFSFVMQIVSIVLSFVMSMAASNFEMNLDKLMSSLVGVIVQIASAYIMYSIAKDAREAANEKEDAHEARIKAIERQMANVDRRDTKKIRELSNLILDLNVEYFQTTEEDKKKVEEFSAIVSTILQIVSAVINWGFAKQAEHKAQVKLRQAEKADQTKVLKEALSLLNQDLMSDDDRKAMAKLLDQEGLFSDGDIKKSLELMVKHPDMATLADVLQGVIDEAKDTGDWHKAGNDARDELLSQGLDDLSSAAALADKDQELLEIAEPLDIVNSYGDPQTDYKDGMKIPEILRAAVRVNSYVRAHRSAMPKGTTLADAAADLFKDNPEGLGAFNKMLKIAMAAPQLAAFSQFMIDQTPSLFKPMTKTIIKNIIKKSPPAKRTIKTLKAIKAYQKLLPVREKPAILSSDNREPDMSSFNPVIIADAGKIEILTPEIAKIVPLMKQAQTSLGKGDLGGFASAITQVTELGNFAGELGFGDILEGDGFIDGVETIGVGDGTEQGGVATIVIPSNSELAIAIKKVDPKTPEGQKQMTKISYKIAEISVIGSIKNALVKVNTKISEARSQGGGGGGGGAGTPGTGSVGTNQGTGSGVSVGGDQGVGGQSAGFKGEEQGDSYKSGSSKTSTGDVSGGGSYDVKVSFKRAGTSSTMQASVAIFKSEARSVQVKGVVDFKIKQSVQPVMKTSQLKNNLVSQPQPVIDKKIIKEPEVLEVKVPVREVVTVRVDDIAERIFTPSQEVKNIKLTSNEFKASIGSALNMTFIS